MGQNMTDSVREASNNPAFRALLWVAGFLLASIISMATFIFTRGNSEFAEGQAELNSTLKDLRTELQAINRSVQDQQTSMTLMQSRVTNLETMMTSTRDSMSKVRDDAQRDGYRIDRLEELTNTNRSAPPRGAR